jgi:NADPH-dependent 2,4-dienoyl-CoA reductase/sulfur reductase-like enzyme
MNNSKIDLLVVGAGPAGLGAAIEAAKRGAKVLVVDENARPGGQLFKQIHKFFGSKEHMAGTRGFTIGQKLLQEAKEYGVMVMLNTLAWGVFKDNVVVVKKDDQSYSIQARKVIIATGATENALSFKGCTKPGVITGGAAQTLVNIQRVIPGKKILVVGTGNVGLIVSYQLMQAGADVVGIVEAAPAIGGYDVHANKVRKAGVPIYLGHTVVEALGTNEVSGAIIAPVDCSFQPKIEESFQVECDTICLAVGLSPRIDLASNAGCEPIFSPVLGGHMPWHDERMRSLSDVYVAGDVAGIEEASTALEEGKLAGVAVADDLGLLGSQERESIYQEIESRLNKLRSGVYGDKRRVAKLELIEMGCKNNEQK